MHTQNETIRMTLELFNWIRLSEIINDTND